MMPISDTQEFALRFNEEEAIWQRFQENRLTRRLREADSPLPESALDQLDWLEAEREIRTARAVANKFAFAPGYRTGSGSDRINLRNNASTITAQQR